VDALTASKIVWLDCLLTNVDRSARNTNMLMWNKDLWLIDHGAALYFHHTWNNWEEQSTRAFGQVKDHVLLPWASELAKADEILRSILHEGLIRSIISVIPDDWLVFGEGSVAGNKVVYERFLINRVTHSRIFIKEAQDAREALI
jgi:hypothetical protein